MATRQRFGPIRAQEVGSMQNLKAKWAVGLGVVLWGCDEPFYCDEPLSCDADAAPAVLGDGGPHGSEMLSASGMDSDLDAAGHDQSSAPPDSSEPEGAESGSTEGEINGSGQDGTSDSEESSPSEATIGEDAGFDDLAEENTLAEDDDDVVIVDVPGVDAAASDEDGGSENDGGAGDSGATDSVSSPQSSAPADPTEPPSEPDACSTAAARKCIGNVVWECQSGTWTEVQTCAAECTGDGVCVGLCDSVVCSAPMCKEAGTCDPESGSCSMPTNVDDDSSCDDENKCTQIDSCQSGECVGSDPVICPAPAVCKVVGTCNPESGSCSAPTNAPNDSTCDDDDACTENDSCQSGLCTGSPILCDDPPACKESTTCSEGTCDYSENVSDGTLDAKCPSGTEYCSSGMCVECATDEQCSGSTPSCRALDHTCVCRLPSSTNLLVNPGFDGSFVGWKNTAACILKTDSEACSESKAASVPSSCQPEQCIRVSTGSYVVGGRFKKDVNAGPDYYFQVGYFTDQSCTDLVDWQTLPGGTPTANWTTHTSNVNVPPGINSVKVKVWCLDFLMDQVFFGTSGQF